jgi:hypothetical protein
MPYRRQVVSDLLVQLADVEVGFCVVRVRGDRLAATRDRRVTDGAGSITPTGHWYHGTVARIVQRREWYETV